MNSRVVNAKFFAQNEIVSRVWKFCVWCFFFTTDFLKFDWLFLKHILSIFASRSSISLLTSTFTSLSKPLGVIASGFSLGLTERFMASSSLSSVLIRTRLNTFDFLLTEDCYKPTWESLNNSSSDESNWVLREIDWSEKLAISDVGSTFAKGSL